MGRKALTFRGIGSLPAGMHADREVRGLYLRVSDTGARSWIFRYQIAGRRRDMGLGGLDVVSIKDARDAAGDLRKLLHNGVDPIDKDDQSKAATASTATVAAWTFKKCAAAVHETLAPGWKNPKHADQWISTLATHAFPKIGERPVGSIGVAEILEVLRPIWSTKGETARRVRQRMDAVMRWAVAHKYATTNPVDAASDLLPKQRDKGDHHPSLPYREVPAFVEGLRKLDVSASRLALEFAILTAARSGEVRGATWAEIDLKSATWTIPAERMKAGREHQVPLAAETATLLALAADCWGSDPAAPLFPGPRSGKALSDMTLTQLVRGMHDADIKTGGTGYADPKMNGRTATVHGFRASFRNWVAETGFSRELGERALAHVVEDKTEAAYNRTTLFEQRIPMMAAWSTFVTTKPATPDRAA